MRMRVEQLRQMIEEELVCMQEDVSGGDMSSNVLLRYAKVAEAYASMLHDLAGSAKHFDVANVVTLLETIDQHRRQHDIALLDLKSNIDDVQRHNRSNH